MGLIKYASISFFNLSYVSCIFLKNWRFSSAADFFLLGYFFACHFERNFKFTCTCQLTSWAFFWLSHKCPTFQSVFYARPFSVFNTTNRSSNTTKCFLSSSSSLISLIKKFSKKNFSDEFCLVVYLNCKLLSSVQPERTFFSLIINSCNILSKFLSSFTGAKS